MGLDSINRWPKILAQLDDTVFFQQQGTLVVAHQQDKGDLQSFAQRLKPLANHQVKSVNRFEIEALEPEFAGRFNQGL
jgi:glycine oxidase